MSTATRSDRHASFLTVKEVCEELRISRSTWDRMVRLGEAPKMKRMGGRRGEIRVRRSWLDHWLEGGDA